MAFALTLIICTIIVMACRNAIKRWPVALYVFALLCDVLLIIAQTGQLPRLLLMPTVLLMRRGGIGVALFVIVMYIGVLPRKSKVSRWLRPIRAELSIAACLFVAGHMCTYLPLYLEPLFSGVLRGNVLLALIVALGLLALVLVLGITSFRFVKRHMKARSWKKLQNWAYLFYVLIYVHLMLMIGPAALAGKDPALTNAIIYTVVFVGYMVLRVVRAAQDRRDKIDLAKTVADQGFEDAETLLAEDGDVQ